MKHSHINEPKKAQRQSQDEKKVTTEVVTLNDKEFKQAVGISKAAKVINAEITAKTEALNLVTNTNTISTEVPEGSENNLYISEESNLQKSQFNEASDVAVEKGKLNDSVKKVIKGIPDLYLNWALGILDCPEEQYYEVAVNTVVEVNQAQQCGWLMIGIAAYRVWISTPAEPGGAYNTVADKEGRVNALKAFGRECQARNITTSKSDKYHKTLYAYILALRLLLEEPLEQFKKGTKRYYQERNILLEKLFKTPLSFVRAASNAKDPIKAFNLAYEKKAIQKDAEYNIYQFREEIGSKPGLGSANSLNNDLFALLFIDKAKKANIKIRQAKIFFIDMLKVVISNVENMSLEE